MTDRVNLDFENARNVGLRRCRVVNPQYKNCVSEGAEWLTVKEVAKMCGRSKSWVVSRQSALSFDERVDPVARRTLISAASVRKFLQGYYR